MIPAVNRLERHEGILTAAEQSILEKAVVCGAGAGGVGGWTYESLARLGCARFRIADPGTFDETNLNRQACSSTRTLGRNKAETVARSLLEIDPGIEVEVFPEGVTEENIEDFLRDGSVVIDGIDLYEMEIKKLLYDSARLRGIPVVSCPILGFGAAIAFFHPTRSPSFERYFGQIPSREDKKAFKEYIERFATGFFCFKPRLDWPLFTRKVDEGKVPSVGMACMLSGALTATNVVSFLLGKDDFPIVPETTHIDLKRSKVSRMGPLKRWFFRTCLHLVSRHDQDLF